MKVHNKVVIVTGGASGIGEAMARRFHRDGAKKVVVADLDAEGAARVGDEVEGFGVGIDVSDEPAIRDLVARTEAEAGPVDLFVSNAGYATVGGLEVSNQELDQMWQVHVMSHIFAARAVLPSMIERGEGYLLSTASAAGLLAQIGSVAYSVTKHAAVALAEWIAITHGPQGIKVSVLCPQAVATNIRQNSPDRGAMANSPGVASKDGVLSSDEVAECVTQALDEERFWVLPHPEVAEYTRRKANDVDRWLSGMQRFQASLFEGEKLPGEWLVGS